MISDDVLKSIIAIIPSIVATLFGGFVTIKLVLLGRKLDEVHTLTNSNMGIQLKLNATNSRWRADSSGKYEDVQAADEAEELLRRHEANQSIVDVGNS